MGLYDGVDVTVKTLVYDMTVFIWSVYLGIHVNHGLWSTVQQGQM